VLVLGLACLEEGALELQRLLPAQDDMTCCGGLLARSQRRSIDQISPLRKVAMCE
jgi:hypothetical protein